MALMDSNLPVFVEHIAGRVAALVDREPAGHRTGQAATGEPQRGARTADDWVVVSTVTSARPRDRIQSAPSATTTPASSPSRATRRPTGPSEASWMACAAVPVAATAATGPGRGGSRR